MSDVIAQVLAGNASYAEEFHDPNLPTAPGKHAALVTCMDSRIDALAAFGLNLGDAHIVRNAGAVVTDDMERSLLLSQYAMDTRTILVIGHTRCGLIGVDEEAVGDTVEAHTGARPTFPIGSITSAEAGVSASVKRLRRSPVLRHTDDVHGYVYDVDTGRLTPVD